MIGDKPEIPLAQMGDGTGEASADRPMLGIDKTGNLTFCIPLHKTSEIFARGFVDVCRTEVLRWYQIQAQKQREIGQLAAKTGFQRFKDKLMGTR